MVLAGCCGSGRNFADFSRI